MKLLRASDWPVVAGAASAAIVLAYLLKGAIAFVVQLLIIAVVTSGTVAAYKLWKWRNKS